MKGGGGCNVSAWVYIPFNPLLASGNSCEVSGDSPAVGRPLTPSNPSAPSSAPQRSSGAAAGQGDPAAAGARQHLWWQYYCQGGVWHRVPPCGSDLRSRNGCRGGQDPWEQRTGPPGYYRWRRRHTVQAAPTVRTEKKGCVCVTIHVECLGAKKGCTTYYLIFFNHCFWE